MSLGLREAVVLLIVLIAAYMLFVLLRMRRLGAARGDGEIPVLQDRESGTPAPQTTPEPTLDELLRQAPDPLPAVRRERARGRDTLGEAATGSGVSRHELEREVDSLRRELASVRSEIQELRHDLTQEVLQLRASQTVSPLYSDAMQMAMGGYSAQMIAERCGIARAEAEMVVGLARSQQGGATHA